MSLIRNVEPIRVGVLTGGRCVWRALPASSNTVKEKAARN